MQTAGQNLYRVLYRMDRVKDIEFQKLVVAHSEKEALSYVDGSIKVSLVESDISLVIPEHYLKKTFGDKHT